jgi:uncharacterized protein YcfJ
MVRRNLIVTASLALAMCLTLMTPAEADRKRLKNTMTGAVVGASVGYLVGGKNGASAGAVVGAIAGAAK